VHVRAHDELAHAAALRQLGKRVHDLGGLVGAGLHGERRRAVEDVRVDPLIRVRHPLER
jgi:hypothetical protein